MGRVNSFRRLRYAQDIGCNSADGTFLAFAARAGADMAVRRLLAWLDLRIDMRPFSSVTITRTAVLNI